MEGPQDGLAFQEDTTNVLLIQDAQTELPNKTLCQGISQVSFPYKLDDMGWHDGNEGWSDERWLGEQWAASDMKGEVRRVVRWRGNARHKWRDFPATTVLQPPTQTQIHNTAEPTNTTQNSSMITTGQILQVVELPHYTSTPSSKYKRTRGEKSVKSRHERVSPS